MAECGAGKDAAAGAGQVARELGEDARTLSARDFEARHGSGFLLLSTAALDRPEGPAATRVELDDFEAAASEDTAGISLRIYPVVRSERSVGHLVTVGRTSNNDIVIPDLSVSRFHAFLKPVGAGRFHIQDAKSTNGSTVNGVSVPAQGNGAPLELTSGDDLRFGQVQLTFLDAHALWEFLRAHEF
ncbi:MAG TPA: FHA domain-containing protein [Myxococcota bacterium]